jgi:hypothetical protein
LLRLTTLLSAASPAGGIDRRRRVANVSPVKKLLEILLCILHPIAVVLIWVTLPFRDDMGFIAKLAWGIASIVPFVPFLYVLTGHDFL